MDGFRRFPAPPGVPSTEQKVALYIEVTLEPLRWQQAAWRRHVACWKCLPKYPLPPSNKVLIMLIKTLTNWCIIMRMQAIEPLIELLRVC